LTDGGLIKTVFPSAKHVRRLGDERGFSLLQILIVLAITGVVAGMAVFGIRSARTSVRLNASARTFAQAAEKARLDAIRRRTTTHVEFTNSNTFEVTMDFNGDGVSETRSYTLESGVVVTDANGTALPAGSDDLPYADFDWRGRTYECNMLFRMKNDRNEQLVVQVAGSGDITVNSSITGLPTVTYANVNSTSDVNPSATLTGTDTKLNLSPCGTTSATPTPTATPSYTPTPTPTPTPEATPENPPCSLTVSTTGTNSLKRKGGGSAYVMVTVNTPGTIVVTPSSNLDVTTTDSQVITASVGGTVSYVVKSNSNSQGTFTIKFELQNSNCSPQTVNVTVVK
jgi:Tfp pilus assembly protein FimT